MQNVFFILIVTIFGGFSCAATALDINITNSAVTVDAKKEQSAYEKRVQEFEKFQIDTKAKQAAKQKEDEAKRQALKNDIENAKADIKAKQETAKREIEKSQADFKAQSEANKQAAKERKDQRKEAFDNFKNSFKTTK